MNNSIHPSDGDRLKQTAQWFQLPWSGAKWHKFVTPETDEENIWKYHSRDHLHYKNLDRWFPRPTDSVSNPDMRQFVPQQGWDYQEYKGADIKSPMTFIYNFHYQATYIWKPSGSVPQTKTFGLMSGVTCDDPGDTPEGGGAYESGDVNCTRIKEDGTHVGTTGVPWAFRQPRVDFPGYNIRNLTMNATTYTGGR